MKTIGAVVGVVVAGALIYWMRPLSPPAVVLLTLVCVGLGTAVGNLFGRRKSNGGAR